ncbi:hypothetical protein [Salisediminibacterium selenitireducens]|uniref:Uncharacterized protein n=1 Tax=Bacillus selenitireducens (strain ATCC 700615 / DSM 15326 / MLS10) TaxID=439292 RepID=D6XZU4_BACIE|nr:hypothetical protein [Salisediminibacterium selenitireducens]ADI00446.1 hypothetical protein Bsel_2960 [[Bacillus] selenitireducens MLS10]
MENYDIEEALRLGIDEAYVEEAVEEADKVLEQFLALERNEQNSFLRLMRTPEQIFKKAENKEDPDVTWEMKEIETIDYETDFSFGIMSSLSARTISHTGTLTLLGITWTRYKIDGRYRYSNFSASTHLWTNAYVDRNYNPTVTHTKQREEGEITQGVYYGEGKFSYKIGVIGTGWGATIGDVTIRVRGNHNGKQGGDLHYKSLLKTSVINS